MTGTAGISGNRSGRTRRVFYDASIAQDDSLKLSGLLRRSDQVLFQFAVGVGVGGEGEALAGVDDLEGTEGNATA